jgi:diguanylate cyclase (GGDEF)-like protein
VNHRSRARLGTTGSGSCVDDGAAALGGHLRRCRLGLSSAVRSDLEGEHRRSSSRRREDEQDPQKGCPHVPTAFCRDHPNEVSAAKGGDLTEFGTASFKFKLVAYFLLLSLLPATAAFWGFSSVAKQSEASRVDARLQAGLRAAIAAYQEELNTATRHATQLAHDKQLQAALAHGDAAVAAAKVAPFGDVRIESRRFNVGRAAVPAAEREVLVVGPRRKLGRVIARVRFDHALLERLHARSGLEDDEKVVVASQGRIVVAPGFLQGRLDVTDRRTTTIEIAGERYRALGARTVGDASGPTLAVLSPQEHIDAASASLRRQLLLGLLGALSLISLVAYFEGRSIVRTVSKIARTANAIARGQLDERVPVKGRDELARLGIAFNQMADQLQARLLELESERGRLRESINRFGNALGATHDPDQLLHVIVETAVESSGAAGGMLVGAEGQIFEVGTPSSGNDRLELPLTAGRDNFGTLFLFGRHFDREAVETVNSLVAQAVTALDNARLHRIVEQQALVDGLTGLANRRHTEERLESELARAERFGGPLSVVVTDLDDFKAVNDVHGHPVGDTVLRAFAEVIGASMREADVAGRWGGEEFLLVLPGTDAAGAALLAERIRAHLAEGSLLTPEGVPVRVTASFGVASYEEGPDRETLVAAADAALYEAKRTGKNRVERAPYVSSRP